MPRLSKSTQDETLLRAALEGLELQRQRIEEQISHVKGVLGLGTGRRRGRPPGRKAAAPAGAGGHKRTLSAAARKRIAAAQKRRWAEYRKSAGKEE